MTIQTAFHTLLNTLLLLLKTPQSFPAALPKLPNPQAPLPAPFQLFQFHIDELLYVIEAELDKKFYDVEIITTDNAALPLDHYLKVKSELHKKYHFLIMVGSGSTCNGLPVCLRTRLKNKLYRSIFVELSYYKGGKGVVNQCYCYDRKYKRQEIGRAHV